MSFLDWLINLLRPSPIAPPPTNTTSLLQAHNRVRREAGVSALTLNSSLASAAQDHAAEMARLKNLSHTGAGGEQPWDRATHAGYLWMFIGENIASGQNSASQVMNSWEESSSHYSNIINSHYRDVGFGSAQDSNGKLYWCALFGG